MSKQDREGTVPPIL